MAEDQDQERTLPATERRLERAREEGQAARSPELVAAAGLLAACIAWWLGGADWIAGF
jgi:flagellar biosynthetic protein FlhB